MTSASKNLGVRAEIFGRIYAQTSAVENPGLRTSTPILCLYDQVSSCKRDISHRRSWDVMAIDRVCWRPLVTEDLFDSMSYTRWRQRRGRLSPSAQHTVVQQISICSCRVQVSASTSDSPSSEQFSWSLDVVDSKRQVSPSSRPIMAIRGVHVLRLLKQQ